MTTQKIEKKPKENTMKSLSSRVFSSSSKTPSVAPVVPENDDITAPRAFAPSQKAAGKDFLRLLQNNMAWYREPSIGTQPIQPVMGVFVDEDIVYRSKQGNFAIRRGGVLLQSADKKIQAIQSDYFKLKFLRCFSDGTEICRLSESRMDQVMALSKANTQMRKRIQEVSSIGFLKSIANFRSSLKDTRQMREWNDQIQSHIRDLTIRHKTGIN